MEQAVEFLSKGDTVRGTLFRPDDAPDGPLPTVVMAGGWCYVKEIVLPHVARIVNLAGVQCLGFDYRGFGESEGQRRASTSTRGGRSRTTRTRSPTWSHATTSMPTRSARSASPTAAATC